jgi:hypothetical protein
LYANAAQRAAGVTRLVPHALVRLLQPEDRLALGEGDRIRLFARERENVAQEGFRPIRISLSGSRLGQ